LRFLGFDLGRPTPDENTIRPFGERLTKAGAIRPLFALFDERLRAAGYLAMGGRPPDQVRGPTPRWSRHHARGTRLPRRSRSRPAAQRPRSGPTDRPRPPREWLASKGRISHIHRKKPKGKPMAERTRKANAKKSAVRARVEHVFAHQKDRMDLFIQTIGQARAETKIALANLAHNIGRFLYHERRPATR
jgi:IS5 family transposase